MERQPKYKHKWNAKTIYNTGDIVKYKYLYYGALTSTRG